MKDDPLKTYREKRDFALTSEPAPAVQYPPEAGSSWCRSTPPATCTTICAWR